MPVKRKKTNSIRSWKDGEDVKRAIYHKPKLINTFSRKFPQQIVNKHHFLTPDTPYTAVLELSDSADRMSHDTVEQKSRQNSDHDNVSPLECTVNTSKDKIRSPLTDLMALRDQNIQVNSNVRDISIVKRTNINDNIAQKNRVVKKQKNIKKRTSINKKTKYQAMLATKQTNEHSNKLTDIKYCDHLKDNVPESTVCCTAPSCNLELVSMELTCQATASFGTQFIATANDPEPGDLEEPSINTSTHTEMVDKSIPMTAVKVDKSVDVHVEKADDPTLESSNAKRRKVDKNDKTSEKGDSNDEATTTHQTPITSPCTQPSSLHSTYSSIELERGFACQFPGSRTSLLDSLKDASIINPLPSTPSPNMSIESPYLPTKLLTHQDSQVLWRKRSSCQVPVTSSPVEDANKYQNGSSLQEHFGNLNMTPISSVNIEAPLPRSSCLASQKPKDANNRHHALLPQQTPKQSHDVFTTEPTQNNSLRCNTRIANSSSKRTPAKSKSLVAPKCPNEVKELTVSSAKRKKRHRRSKICMKNEKKRKQKSRSVDSGNKKALTVVKTPLTTRASITKSLYLWSKKKASTDKKTVSRLPSYALRRLNVCQQHPSLIPDYNTLSESEVVNSNNAPEGDISNSTVSKGDIASSTISEKEVVNPHMISEVTNNSNLREISPSDNSIPLCILLVQEVGYSYLIRSFAGSKVIVWSRNSLQEKVPLDCLLE